MNWWEVMVRAPTLKGEEGERVALDLMDAHQVEVALIGSEDASVAFEAFRQYGGRPARLNMGDCEGGLGGFASDQVFPGFAISYYFESVAIDQDFCGATA